MRHPQPQFSKGAKVLVKELKGSATERTFQLDSAGNMLSMVGSYHTVDDYADHDQCVYIRHKGGQTYLFKSEDVEPYIENEPEPIIFEFNPEHLDVKHGT